MSGFKMVIYFHDNILERHCTPFNIPCAANFLTALLSHRYASPDTLPPPEFSN